MTSPNRATRGRTRPGRLRALDQYLLRFERPLLEGPFIDLGFGETPSTTLEAAALFREVAPSLQVVGLELDPARVQAAATAQSAHTRFQLGGFQSLSPLGPARLIRVMNVLRGYRSEELPQAHALLGAALEEGGLAVEGSADPSGRLLCCHLLRRRAGVLHREALLFFTDFECGFAPMQFRDWLPRDLRRRVLPGEPIHAFFRAWTFAWEQTRRDQPTPKAAFAASLRSLAANLPGVAGEPWLVDHGYLLWRPEGGVPR
ncbi:MAG: methylase [Myxococcota bacterium]|nr:methylase [Myxococcota bacterium]